MKRVYMLIVSLACFTATFATIYTGYCGAETDSLNVTWSLNTEDSTLTITGVGEMIDFLNYGPWHAYRDSIKNIYIGDSVTSIGESAFYAYKNVENVYLTDSIIRIGRSAFNNCGNLININVPQNLISIGNSVFWGCKKIASFVLPPRIESIGSQAFFSCQSIDSIYIPERLKRIGDGAFAGCKKIKAFNISPSNEAYMAIDGVLYSIARDTIVAFPCGKNATEYTIPETVHHIYGYAFYGCGLRYVSLPPNLQTIGNSAFASSYIRSVAIPDGTTDIGAGTFMECRDLASVSIPSSIKTLKMNAFNGCSVLDSIVLPSSITTINTQAFSGCKILCYVSLPDNLEVLADRAFYRCPLKRLSLPASLNSIGRECFLGENLTCVRIRAKNPPYLKYENPFYFTDKNNTQIDTLYVSVGCEDSYRSDSIWAKLFTNIVAMSTVSDITETSAKLYWRPDTAVTLYKIDVYQNTTHIAHYEVDGNGHVISGPSGLPSIYHQKMDTTTSSTDYFVISLGGLSAGTDYNYTIDGTNAQNMSVYHEEGSFTTQSEPVPGLGITETPDDPRCARKILRNGHVFIIIGNETYTLQGQKIKDR